VIIGPHGGGLSNIVFCEEGASVYELFSDHYVNPCFNRLAQSAALDYWADMFPASGEGNLHKWTWEVNMEIFKDRFAHIMARQNIRS
jgi:capsular polysaccharide biosynthesis protein